jgi:hypothetical protein
MNAKKTFVLSWAVLFLTVPWWFDTVSSKWFNLPDWGLYAMASGTIYSLLLALIIQKFWKTADNE